MQKNVSFYQDRLGTNIGKTQKRVAFRIVVTVLSVPLSTWLLPKLGPFRSLVIGQALATVAIPLKVLPWCGSLCKHPVPWCGSLCRQPGPYASVLCSTVASALAGPANIMYLAAALRPIDLAQAQSALLLVQTVLANVSPMFFSALFFGDREAMTSGYMLAMVMSAVTVAVTAALMPRQLTVQQRRADDDDSDDAG